MSEASTVAPPPGHPEPNEREDWKRFIQLAIRGSEELRNVLGIEERGFLRVAGQAVADARGYVLYAVLDEVQKAGMQMMQLSSLLRGEAVSPSTDRMSRLFVTSVIEQERARERRLVEVLVNLVLFADTNEQAYYRHLLMIEELDDMLHANGDIEEFHGARSANVDAAIAMQTALIVREQPAIDFARVWYLEKDAKPIPPSAVSPAQLRRTHVKPTNVRTRIRRAMPTMTPSERLATGTTYAEAYGSPSEAVHFSMNAKPHLVTNGFDEALVTKLGLLVMAILVRCYRLLGEPHAPMVAAAARASTQSDDDVAGDLLRRLTRRDVSVGDFVLAMGDLAEVLEIQESAYGHHSFRIRYLAEHPLPDVVEDWFPARYVRRVYTRAQALASMEEVWVRHRLDPALLQRIREAPADELQEALRESLRKNWPLLRHFVDRPARDEKPPDDAREPETGPSSTVPQTDLA